MRFVFDKPLLDLLMDQIREGDEAGRPLREVHVSRAEYPRFRQEITEQLLPGFTLPYVFYPGKWLGRFFGVDVYMETNE